MENLFTSSPPQPKTTVWTFEENTMFENFIAEFNITSAVVFERIAFRFPGKTMDQIKQHYQALVEDVEKIELGLVPLPDYKDVNSNEISKSAIGVETKPGYQHRRKVVPWSKEEHEFVLICSPNGNFLTGLAMYGKGDWKSISRYSVRTRNPTQVASHAQKYYLRLNKNPNPRQNASSASQPNKPFNAPAVVASSFGSSVYSPSHLHLSTGSDPTVPQN